MLDFKFNSLSTDILHFSLSIIKILKSRTLPFQRLVYKDQLTLATILTRLQMNPRL